MILAEVVLTGGPCGGKTTALEIIRQEFSQRGIRVLTVPEVATMFITSGFSDIDLLSPDAYVCLEKAIVQTQLAYRRIFRGLAENFQNRCLIVYDRAEYDIAAYVDDFDEIVDTSQIQDYDLVLHLMTAAKGAPLAYNLANPARRETTLQKAIVADDRTIRVWQDQPNVVVIDNSTDFQAKMARVIEQIELKLSTSYR